MKKSLLGRLLNKRSIQLVDKNTHELVDKQRSTKKIKKLIGISWSQAESFSEAVNHSVAV